LIICNHGGYLSGAIKKMNLGSFYCFNKDVVCLKCIVIGLNSFKILLKLTKLDHIISIPCGVKFSLNSAIRIQFVILE